MGPLLSHGTVWLCFCKAIVAVRRQPVIIVRSVKRCCFRQSIVCGKWRESLLCLDCCHLWGVIGGAVLLGPSSSQTARPLFPEVAAEGAASIELSLSEEVTKDEASSRPLLLQVAVLLLEVVEKALFPSSYSCHEISKILRFFWAIIVANDELPSSQGKMKHTVSGKWFSLWEALGGSSANGQV